MPTHFLARRALLLALLCLAAGSAAAESARRDLLFYVGTTMVPPMSEIARIFEQQEGVTITIAQGVSENLYRSAKKSRVGDLYLPGEPGYRERYLAEGLLGEYVIVGHNRLTMLVRKGNPKGIKGDLRELLRPDLAVMIGTPDSSSVGAEAKRVLDAAGIYSQVVDKAVFLAPDSRTLSMGLRKGEADVILNWRAAAFFAENALVFESIDIGPHVAKPQALQLTLLTFSKHSELVRRFMRFATSEQGQAIFRRNGFLEGDPAGG